MYNTNPAVSFNAKQGQHSPYLKAEFQPNNQYYKSEINTF
jgi:hypothetical protein